jgi:hypothetical protein
MRAILETALVRDQSTRKMKHGPRMWLRRFICHHPAIAVLCVGLFSLIPTIFFALRSFPTPSNMDEFSTLLAADTFAHGRFTNPTPPLYRHFQTLHVIVQPTYNSKYMPGGALILGLGQRAFGHPVAGLWISTALCCGAITWMLLAWMPAEWAVLGGVTAAFFPLISQFARFYLCCNFAVFGGALLLGAFRRLIRKPGAVNSLAFGLGVSVVGLMRPYEGAVLSALVFLWLLLRSRRFGFWIVARKSLLPAALVILMMLSFVGYYNWRVTGHAAELPYSLYTKDYGSTPLFLFQHSVSWDASLRYPWAARFNTWERAVYDVQHTIYGFFWYLIFQKLYGCWHWYKSFLLLGLLGLPFAFRSRLNREVAVVFLLWFAAELLCCWLNLNYVAPTFAFCFLLLFQGLRALARLHLRAFPIGIWLCAFAVVACIAMRFSTADPWPTYKEPYGYDRANILSFLQTIPGRHLVVVRCGPKHPIAAEWVYNQADIEHSPVIWARDLGSPANRELLAYFHDRHVWILQPDESLVLQPYHD